MELVKRAKNMRERSGELPFADSSLRCASCRKIFTYWHGLCNNSGFEEKLFDWYAEFAALDLSAEAGCDICRLLRQSLIYYSASFDDLVNIRLLLQSNGRVAMLAGDKNMGPVLMDPLAMRSVTWAPSPDVLHSSIESIVEFIRCWIDKCSSKSGPLDLKSDLPGLPTRLLDVGLEDQSELRLVLGCEIKQCHYLALSYCWGAGNGPAKTTNMNISERQERFRLESLPQTIQDAILVTRKLDVRYLWVDAICIIQPTSKSEATDWAQESMKMGQYYRNALCTIAATGSSDSAHGMLQYRPGLRFPTQRCIIEIPGQERKFYLEPKLPSITVCIDLSPLYRRGWAMQERRLSTRTAHFCRDAVFLEDFSTITCEFKEEPMQKKELQRRNWHAIVEKYMSAELTFETDRLLAISGIAKLFYEQEADDYFAGLWRKTMIEDLAWKITAYPTLTTQDQKKDYIAPSWSWASARTAIEFFGFTSTKHPLGLEVAAKFINAHIVPATAGQEYGHIQSGMLQIEGQVVYLHVNRYNKDKRYYLKSESDGSHHSVGFDKFNIIFDDGDKKSVILRRIVASLVKKGLLCLFLCKVRHEGYFLILESISDTEYRRVGCMTTNIGWDRFFREANRKMVQIV